MASEPSASAEEECPCPTWENINSPMIFFFILSHGIVLVVIVGTFHIPVDKVKVVVLISNRPTGECTHIEKMPFSS